MIRTMRSAALAIVLVAASPAAQAARESSPVGAPLTCAHPSKSLLRDLDPAWSLDGRRIAFIRTDREISHLFVANADGSAARAVTEAESEPAWVGPSRTELVFELGRTIYLVDVATASARPLVEGLDPSVSPDGSRLAFARGGVIWLMALDGSAARPLTRPGTPAFPHSDRTPAWSPDGAVIAFTRDAGVDTVGIDVWVVDANGGDPRRVTNNDTYNLGPTWSPDGTRLAFGSVAPNLNMALHSIRVDGSDERALTRRTRFGTDATRGRPSWSPRGVIAFQAAREIDTEWGSELRTIRPDGSGERRLSYHCQAAVRYWLPNVLDGTSLPDVIRGYAGGDVIRGYAGGDRLFGGTGPDRIDAGSGADLVDGGTGTDRLLAGPGHDFLRARDGWRDAVRCGPGRDLAVVDRLDVVDRTCERIARR
jgi:TolB protein